MRFDSTNVFWMHSCLDLYDSFCGFEGISCFTDSPLPVFFLLIPFLFGFPYSIGSFSSSSSSLLASPSLLRHQTWALLRSVERALGSTNRITGVARAGVYGVCLHLPRPGEGWVTVCWDFLRCSVLLLPPLCPPPSLRLSHQAIGTSQLPPATPCSLGFDF